MSVFRGLSDAWKGLAVIVAALSIGGMATLSVVGFISLPERVTKTELGIMANDSAIGRNVAAITRDSLVTVEVRREGDDHNAKLDRIICILNATAQDTPPTGCAE